MPPSWTPVCQCMQRYCEPYFAAIDCWRKYSNFDLLVNRIQLLESVSKILLEFSQNPDTYEFKLVYENSDCTLLEETAPSAGFDFVIGGDIHAFKASKDLVPELIFNKAGIFFQNNVMKPIAGFDETSLATANIATRNAVIKAVETLLRLPEEAGKAHFEVQLKHTVEATQPYPYEMKELSESSAVFAKLIKESANLKRAGDCKVKEQGDSGKSKRGKKQARAPEEIETVDWIKDHESVGMRLAAYFAVDSAEGKGKGVQRKLFHGEIKAYAPPSSSKSKDQLYHVQWEDGDEEDYDEVQMQKGRELFRTLASWSPDHESVGQKVAARCGKGRGKDKGKQQLVQGEVSAFCPATSSARQDQQYQVLWEDGELTELDQEAFQLGRELYDANFETNWVSDHSSLGTEVAAYFELPGKGGKKRRLFRGKVAKFAPASSPEAGDQLYRIEWEDGDEEDYDEAQLQAAIELAASQGAKTPSKSLPSTPAARTRGRPRRSVGEGEEQTVPMEQQEEQKMGEEQVAAAIEQMLQQQPASPAPSPAAAQGVEESKDDKDGKDAGSVASADSDYFYQVQSPVASKR